ncbi:hypothetical protein IM792_06050 [Mucilaginibacter sp. JRF]|uniref:hypothetical protein n=1 Tax=Mucilaginibacter sp. JRF TaxID=2780088 RepID=UPI001880975D|nr:hypothetical protein [Mucilaginibacter sp. JRF]MBE9584005.1 hypothetical protein [Mucilaginibacter sp. JRF]
MPFQLRPADGGMLYTETDLHHYLPEPLNMITAALFFIPAVYWLIKLKGFNREHVFLSVATYLLLIASIGGTIYHGLRQWRIFIYMDWVPIALLCLMASVYFWHKLLGKWYYGMLALLIFIGVVTGIRMFMPLRDIQLAISLNYGVMVVMVVLPLALLLNRMQWRNAGLVAASLLSFAVALFFRVADKWQWVSIGTHFLWHFFGVVATAAIFAFIYRLNDPASSESGKNVNVSI